MAANDPLILKRNAGDTGFEEVSGASNVRNTLGATAGVFPGALVASATDAAAGVVELATPTEVTTGTDTTRAVTPAGSKAALDAREALVLERMATREAAGYLWSDGVTSNRAQIQTPGPRGNLAGAPLASWVGWVTVPAASTTAEIAGESSSSTALASASAWSLGIAWSTDALVVRANGATPATDFRTLTISGLRSSFSSQRVWLEVRITAGTSTPVVRVNGSAQSGTAADGAGTDPDWLSASLVATNHLTGYNWPVGPAPIGCWLNAHLTDAESETWRITGRPPAWVVAGGYAGQLIHSAWVSGVVGGVTRTSSGPDNLGLDGTASSQINNSPKIPYITPQSIWRLSWTQNATGVRLNYGGGIQIDASPGFSQNGFNAVAGQKYVVVRGGFPNFYLASGDTTTALALSDIKMTFAGALSRSVVLPINALGDGTVLGDNPARLVGIQPVTTRKDWQITARTSTSGNEQILGGSFLDTTRDVIDSIEQTPETGTPTTTVGSASGGAQYKASGALAAGINTPALVTRKTDSANVWVGSSTADPVRTTITGHSH